MVATGAFIPTNLAYVSDAGRHFCTEEILDRHSTVARVDKASLCCGTVTAEILS